MFGISISGVNIGDFLSGGMTNCYEGLVFEISNSALEMAHTEPSSVCILIFYFLFFWSLWNIRVWDERIGEC